MPTATVNGIHLYYELTGQGPAVTFLHGFTLDGRMWADQVPVFAQQYRVLVPDLRGFGRSYCGLHLLVRCSNASLAPMAAYSIDLRQKILHAYERRLGSQRAIAELFGVSVSFVEKLLRRYRTAGDIAPKPHAGGQRPRLDPKAQTVVRGVLHDHPDATLVELCASVATATGVRVSVATMCRLLQRLGWPRKKSHSTRPSATRHVSSTRGQPTAG